MVEVEDTYSTSTITRDFNWLLKVCSHWHDIRQLKADLERLTGVTSYSLRSQLLNAAIQFQVQKSVWQSLLSHFASFFNSGHRSQSSLSCSFLAGVSQFAQTMSGMFKLETLILLRYYCGNCGLLNTYTDTQKYSNLGLSLCIFGLHLKVW